MCVNVNRTEQEEEVIACIPGSQPSTLWCQYKGMTLYSSSYDVHVLACYSTCSWSWWEKLPICTSSFPYYARQLEVALSFVWFNNMLEAGASLH